MQKIRVAWEGFVKPLSAWNPPKGVTVEKIEQAKRLLFEEDKLW